MVREQNGVVRRKQKPVTVEVVIDSAESAVAAEQGGAGRVELCANLAEGGTTPVLGEIERVRRVCTLPVYVMIRPRAGDFCYSDDEFAIMKRDLHVARDSGAEGVVLGILDRANRVDRRRVAHLVRLARPLGVTFHRAFDLAANPLQALEEVIASGAERILTSGGPAGAYEGREGIRQLIEQAGHRIAIMPGGGVTLTNVSSILASTGAHEIHVGSAVRAASRDSGGSAGNLVSASRLRRFILEAGLARA